MICQHGTRLRHLAVVLAALVATMATLAATGRPAAASSGPALVLLGDSYSSGQGAGPYDPDTDTGSNHCHRSAHSWQRLYVPRTPFSHDWTHIACSGATTGDFYNPQAGQAGQPAQRSALSDHTALVLLTMGGNDVGFADVATRCIVDRQCRSRYVVNGDDTELDRIRAMQNSITRFFSDVAAAAPNAAVYALTYPNIINTAPRLFCSQDGNLPKDDRDWLKQLTRQLDNTLIRAATTAGIHIVDAFGAFAGHELCTDDPWANPLLSTSDRNEWLHPNAKGQTALENQLTTAIRLTPVQNNRLPGQATGAGRHS
jgi:lysophospholipase L1-like esterase